MTKVLRIDGQGNVEYPKLTERDNWPFGTDLAGAVLDGRLKNIVTDFLRVNVKP